MNLNKMACRAYESGILLIDTFAGGRCTRLHALTDLATDAVEAVVHMFHSDRAADELWDWTTRQRAEDAAERLAEEEELREAWLAGELKVTGCDACACDEEAERDAWDENELRDARQVSNSIAQGIPFPYPAHVDVKEIITHLQAVRHTLQVIAGDLTHQLTLLTTASSTADDTGSAVDETPTPPTAPGVGVPNSADGAADRAGNGPAADAPPQEPPPGVGQPKPVTLADLFIGLLKSRIDSAGKGEAS